MLAMGVNHKWDAFPSKDSTCRGFVTADVLEQGLSRTAIALGSLKGLIGTKDTGEFLY